MFYILVSFFILVLIHLVFPYKVINLQKQNEKISLEIDYTLSETDDRKRNCSIYFSYNEFLVKDKKEIDYNTFIEFLNASKQSNEWYLLFKFDNYKIMKCQSKFPNYKCYDTKDVENSSISLLIDQIEISPKEIYDITQKVNSSVTNQEWIFELLKNLNLQNQLKSILNQEKNIYSITTNLLKMKKEKVFLC